MEKATNGVEKLSQTNGLVYYKTNITHTFQLFPNEIKVENGSPLFHALREDTLSGSRIAEAVGLSKYGLPRDCALHYYIQKEENEAMITGKVEEPNTRASFLVKTRFNTPLRECGIFFLKNCTRMSAMPDDVASVDGMEVPVEYKFLMHPYVQDHPKLEHICQSMWQMGVSGMQTFGYLVYRWMDPNVQDYKIRVWKVCWLETFFKWMLYRAVLFLSYLDNPCEEALPTYSHLYYPVNAMLQKGTWHSETAANSAMDRIPPGPHICDVDFKDLETHHFQTTS